MKVEAWIFTYMAIYFAVLAAIYGWATNYSDGQVEMAGFMAILLSFALAAMIAGYLWLIRGKIDKRPEDDPDGEIYQGAGEYGFFPPHSMWPFWCALAIGVMVLGPVFGWWITGIGGGIGAWAAAGWCYEYYRGDYAH